MIIAHNISALNTYKSLGIAGNQADNSMEKLSSGYKINKAADDAAGLSISEKMRSQIRGLNQAATNAENGVSMIQTAEGALNEEHAILQRMRELAVQAATDTNAKEDREALQSEMAQLSSEINRIGSTTEFNGMKILNGEKGSIEVSPATHSNTYSNHGFKFEAIADGAAGNLEFSMLGYYSGSTTSVDTSDGKAVVYLSSADQTIMSGTDTAAKQAIIDAANEELKAAGVRWINTGSDHFEAVDLFMGARSSFTFTGGQDAVKESNPVYFHVGANSNQVISTEFNDMRATALGIVSETDDGTGNFSSTKNVNNGTDSTSEQYSLNITTRDGANNAIEIIDEAIKKVSNERSKYGAIQNRLEYTINNLNTTAENMTAAESTIRDVDMADEMMAYTKNNILQQAAQAMLVQANARPQQALQLLQ